MPATRPSRLYKLLLLLLSLPGLGYIIYRSLKDGGWRYFSQRLGFNYTPSIPASILIHCASVGEVNAAKPLMFALREKFPDKTIVVSTNTPTGAQVVAKLQDRNIFHVYLPLDYFIPVNHFLNSVDPNCILILETEIWPTLFFTAANKGIPISIINGRLSNKSLHANHVIKNEWQSALKNLTLLLTRSSEDRARFISCGANEKTTHAVGNLKYAGQAMVNEGLPCTPINRPFLLAVSTHADEELQLAAHTGLLEKENYLLVIAPRYPGRGKKLLPQLRHVGHNVALRSNQDPITGDTNIYIVDTLGELDMFYNEAALVFVGGSLIKRGGHNILEPANFGKCVMVGPHTDNFALEVQELLAANGIIQITDNAELGSKLAYLLKNDHERMRYGLNARQFIEQKATVIMEYVERLQPLVTAL